MNAKLAAEEPDARGVEWLSYPDPSHILSGRPRRRSERKRDSGLDAGPPGKNI